MVKEGEEHSIAGKRAKFMSGNTRDQGDPLKGDTEEKKRGRPLGSKNKTQPVLRPGEILPPPSPSKSKPGSPKRAKSRANARTDASIDLAYLKLCDPSV